MKSKILPPLPQKWPLDLKNLERGSVISFLNQGKAQLSFLVKLWKLPVFHCVLQRHQESDFPLIRKKPSENLYWRPSSQAQLRNKWGQDWEIGHDFRKRLFFTPSAFLALALAPTRLAPTTMYCYRDYTKSWYTLKG